MRGAKPPAAPGWVHEIKHDSYRLIVRRDGDTVRRGHVDLLELDGTDTRPMPLGSWMRQGDTPELREMRNQTMLFVFGL
jgi:hypothetical protein